LHLPGRQNVLQAVSEGFGLHIYERSVARIYDLDPALRGGTTSPAGELSDGVERVVRHSPSHDYEFLVIHTGSERKVQLAAPGYDLLADRPVDGTLALEGRGVAIVRT
jgi:hypothetical protein